MCKANQYRTGKTTKKKERTHELDTKSCPRNKLYNMIREKAGNLERDYISVTGQDVKRRISPAVSINSPVLEDRVTYTPACISLKASVLNKNKINARLQISRDYPLGNVFFLHFFFSFRWIWETTRQQRLANLPRIKPEQSVSCMHFS